MNYTNTLFKKLFFLLIYLISSIAFGQAIIKVTVTSIQTSGSIDCDNSFLEPGESDFVWEYTATDNTLGYTNNNPASFGFFDFNYINLDNNNGPINSIVNFLFFDHQYICPADVPSVINLAWEAYENDDASPYDLPGFFGTDGATGLQNVQLIVPSFNGISDTTFSAVGTSGCPNPVTYTINLQIERINLSFEIMEDNICDAVNIPVDNSTHTYALCNSLTIEPNEPIFPNLETDTRGSAWFYFTLPANSSGNIRIDTDLPETNFGTEIALYHAADGFGCIQGTNNFNSLQVKNKFNYLSEHSFADDDIPFIDPQGLATGNWNGGLISEGEPLIPGETYYLQFNSDAANQQGSVGFRITDLGGIPTSLNDIPCTSPLFPGGTPATSISSENTNGGSPNLTLNYSNATDREAGSNLTNTNAENYVAYTYSPPSGTSNTIGENVWFNFTAPNSGRVYFEGEITSFIGLSEAEDIALYALDERFAPGQPTDLFCSNLTQIDASAGSVSGTNRTAKINATCLEPGYQYYGMLDPQSFSTVSNGKVWMYDPSIADPSFNAPGNDILCLAITDTLYEVPVILAGTNPTFQAVAGSNVRACREFLAGEPAANPNENLRADQTVWHYFVAPPSGAVEMSIRAYVGMDTLRYNVFELLNGTDCYGGLNPATYTVDGTQSTPLIQPIISGTAGFTGSQTSACCLQPGKLYAIQIDGGSPGDEGQYIIEYIQEVASDAGDIYVELANGDSLTNAQQDTAFVCYGDIFTPGITVNGIGESTQSLPDCLTPGYVIHQVQNLPEPIANTGFNNAYIDSLIGLNGTFTNNGDGSGSFGNPLFNTLYYLSPAGDITSTWGTFACGTATVATGLPIVFLEPLLTPNSYNNGTCTLTFSASGGLNGYNNSPYSYSITNPSGVVVQTGSLNPGASINYVGGLSGQYTVEVNDGACSNTFTFLGCNSCSTTTIYDVTASICQGESIFLGGALQTESAIYTDVFVTSLGCDSIVNTNLTVYPVDKVTKEHSLCPGGSIQIGTSVYTSQGVYVDTLQAITGCDSIVTSVVFMLPVIKTNINATICSGSTYSFNGTAISLEGVYEDTLATADGCDSIVVLSLFVTPPNSSYEVAEICIGESFTFGNQTYSTSGIYQDTLQNSAGCDSLSILELSVIDCEFQISNILTPNDDGQNDTWRVSDLSKITDCNVTIFNRWGEPVFTTTNYQNDWGGTREGEPLPDGVYFYAIKCSDKEFTGSINLLRFKK